jgi:hypothetical protein
MLLPPKQHHQLRLANQESVTIQHQAEFSSVSPEQPTNTTLTNREVVVLVMFVLTAFSIIIICVAYLICKLVREDEEEADANVNLRNAKHSLIHNPNSTMGPYNKNPSLSHYSHQQHKSQSKHLNSGGSHGLVGHKGRVTREAKLRVENHESGL